MATVRIELTTFCLRDRRTASVQSSHLLLWNSRTLQERFPYTHTKSHSLSYRFTFCSTVCVLRTKRIKHSLMCYFTDFFIT